VSSTDLAHTDHLTSAIQMVSQVLIWALTLYKYMDLQRSSGWQTIPVLSLVARDGSWVFVSSSSKCFVQCQRYRLNSKVL